MFIYDLPNILKWWGYILILGVIFFPITWSIFKKFFGLGYALSKTFGIILLSYLTFLLATFHIAKFSRTNLFIYLFIFLLINIYIFYKYKNQIFSDLKKNVFRIIFSEILFAFGLFIWSFVRAHQPDIRGLEKFMDYGFVNSALRSDYLPPTDMWAAGHTINYYWFGHFVTALLTKLSNIPSEITYNLMLATIMGLVLSSAQNITSTLFEHIKKNTKKRYVFLAGIISAFILVFAGNFHTPFYVLKNGVDNYWYPDATRFIGYNPDTNDKTIHEFPIYSFVVADLHGHLLNLPFVLMFLAFAFKIVSDKKNNTFKIKNIIFPGILLGVMFMTSTWDFGNYLLTLGFVLLFSSAKDREFKIVDIFIEVAKIILICIPIAIIVALPFIIHFESIAQGIKFVHSHSPLWQLAILWGFPAVLTIFFFNTIRKLSKKITISDAFVLSLLTSAWVLIALPEIIYVKDIYAATHYRANTMFKLTYQAFVMSYLVGGYVVVRQIALEKYSYIRRFLSIFWMAILFSILAYAQISTNSYYGNLKNYFGLNGTKWLSTQYPDAYQVVYWLRQNAPKGSILLEAPGDSYTDYNVISAYTGIPTVSGWFVHEWLWRGAPEFPQTRVADITNIYNSTDPQAARAILEKYNVNYIIVGSFEREKFPSLDEMKFLQFASVAFQTGSTTVYKLN